jgi:hypothetical protein
MVENDSIKLRTGAREHDLLLFGTENVQKHEMWPHMMVCEDSVVCCVTHIRRVHTFFFAKRFKFRLGSVASLLDINYPSAGSECIVW